MRKKEEERWNYVSTQHTTSDKKMYLQKNERKLFVIIIVEWTWRWEDLELRGEEEKKRETNDEKYSHEEEFLPRIKLAMTLALVVICK